mmetsp:Transcript_14345/g.42833  ORF Transcript_14345/g.42833 Transcript_14345/m.42833 type:complete len:999 (+) Transcript_14345:499-3495(+)
MSDLRREQLRQQLGVALALDREVERRRARLPERGLRVNARSMPEQRLHVGEEKRRLLFAHGADDLRRGSRRGAVGRRGPGDRAAREPGQEVLHEAGELHEALRSAAVHPRLGREELLHGQQHRQGGRRGVRLRRRREGLQQRICQLVERRFRVCLLGHPPGEGRLEHAGRRGRAQDDVVMPFCLPAFLCSCLLLAAAQLSKDQAPCLVYGNLLGVVLRPAGDGDHAREQAHGRPLATWVKVAVGVPDGHTCPAQREDGHGLLLVVPTEAGKGLEARLVHGGREPALVGVRLLRDPSLRQPRHARRGGSGLDQLVRRRLGVPGEVAENRGEQLRVLGAVLPLAEALLQVLRELLEVVRRRRGGQQVPRLAPREASLLAEPLEVGDVPLQPVRAAAVRRARGRAHLGRPGNRPHLVLGVQRLAQPGLPVHPYRSQAVFPGLLISFTLIPRRDLADKVVEQVRGPLASSLQPVEVEVRGGERVERVGAPGDGRQHRREVPDGPHGPLQGARSVLLEGPGALPQHLLVLAVGGHGGEDCPDAAARAADHESVLLPGEREERLGPDPLQLRARPVVGHRLDDGLHAPVVGGQEAGAQAGDDQNALRQDVGPVLVQPHHDLQDLEGVHGHAVVVEELPERGQRRAALELDLRVLLEEAHGLEHPSQPLEGPDLVEALAWRGERDDADAVRRGLPGLDVDPPEHLAAADLDLMLLVVVVQHGDEVRGLEVLQEGAHAAGVVPREVVQDNHAALHHLTVRDEPLGERDDPLQPPVGSQPQAPLDVLRGVLHERLEAGLEVDGLRDGGLRLVKELLGRQRYQMLPLRDERPVRRGVDGEDLRPHLGELQARIVVERGLALRRLAPSHQGANAICQLPRNHVLVRNQHRARMDATSDDARQHREGVRVLPQGVLPVRQDLDEALQEEVRRHALAAFVDQDRLVRSRIRLCRSQRGLGARRGQVPRLRGRLRSSRLLGAGRSALGGQRIGVCGLGRGRVGQGLGAAVVG